MSLPRTFGRIYRGNEWAGTDTRSGPGSSKAATWRTALDVLELVRELAVRSVVDAACGEGLWQPPLPGYVGVDVAPEAIDAARRNHPDRTYMVHDVREWCHRADLVILRDAMQHLSLADGQLVLDAIRASGSAHLLASTFVGGANVDIRTGEAYGPDLEAAPFLMGPALRLYHDGWAYDGSYTLRDPRKMLGLWQL